MRLFKQFIVCIVTFFYILGCSGNGSTAGGDSFPSGATPSTTTNVEDATPLYFYVTTKYEDESDDSTREYYHGTCQIDPENLAANILTCNLAIPEGMLRYSDTSMIVGTNDSSLCYRIEYFPFYRQVTNSAAYQPPWSVAPIDCSVSPTPAECYEGAARHVVTGFPALVGRWFNTSLTQRLVTTVPAGYTDSYGNTRVCNNLAVGSRGADIILGGVPVYLAAGGFQDYVVRCVDQYQETQFQLTITIEDTDFDPAGINHIYDWY